MARRNPPKPVTILVVDDEPGVLKVIQALLESRGYVVHAAARADKALDLFTREQARWDMIVADVIMPGMSGPELVQRILPSRPDLAVLFISGNVGDARVQELLSRNAISFLAKPFTIRDFESRVAELLRARAPGAAA